MAQVVIAEFMDEEAVAALRDEFSVAHDPEAWRDAATLAALLGEAEALIVRNRTQVTAEVLGAAPRLRAVGRLGVGLDNIDLDACAARDIAVLPATGANALSVAEYVVTSVLALLRGAYQANASVAAGEWPRERFVGSEAGGKVLGLIGFGSIGQETARLAGALGMEVIAHDPVLGDDADGWRLARRAGFDDVLAQSDAVSLHMPLNDATRGLIGAQAIAAMKPGAVLINTARGGIVDEAALVAALRERRLGGAALDVFASEPLDAAAGALFDGVDNLILTPHIAGVTRESNKRVSAVTAQNVARVLRGAA